MVVCLLGVTLPFTPGQLGYRIQPECGLGGDRKRMWLPIVCYLYALIAEEEEVPVS